jgi:hypothetical protein
MKFLENGTTLNKGYYKALTLRYESQMAEAKANLDLYFSNGNLAAIGEHSDLLAEHDRWIEAYANAKDKLESLKSLYEQHNVESV